MKFFMGKLEDFKNWITNYEKVFGVSEGLRKSGYSSILAGLFFWQGNIMTELPERSMGRVGLNLNNSSSIEDALTGKTGWRNIVYKNEEEGVKDMRSELGGLYEDTYIYLPEKKKWIEVGIKSEIEIDTFEARGKIVRFLHKTGTSLDEHYLKDLLKENPSIVMYHFQPSGFDGTTAKDITKLLETFGLDNSDGKIYDKVKDVMISKGAIIGSADLNQTMTTALWHNSYHPQGRFAYKVVSKKE